MKIIIEVETGPAMLGAASRTRTAFAIAANSANVLPFLPSEKNVGAEIDRLSSPLESSTDPCKLDQIHALIDHDKDIGILGDCLVCCQRTNERDPLHTGTD
jgi:hypothetical protein